MRHHLDRLWRILAALALALGSLALPIAAIQAQTWTAGVVHAWNCSPEPTDAQIAAEDANYVSLPAGGCYVEVRWSRSLTSGDVVRVVGGSGTNRVYALIGSDWIDYGNFGDYLEFNVTTTITRIRVQSATGSTLVDFVGAGLASPTAVPTSTPFVLPTQACIPAGSVPTATPTALPRTPTVFPRLNTPTPGGTPATATPTPATATPTAPPYYSDTARFDNGLAPWTITGGSGAWTVSVAGPDTRPGVAQFTNYGVGLSLSAFEVSYTIDFDGPALVFPTNLTFPLRLTGHIRTSDILAGSRAYLAAYYLDETYEDLGQTFPAWVRFGSMIPVQMAWGQFDFRLTDLTGVPPGTTALALAVGLVASSEYTHPVVQVYADDLRVVAGNLSAVMSSYPICAPGTGYVPAPQTKICPVRLRTVDVFAICRQPDDALDFGGWIDYLACYIAGYFAFGDANQQQLNDLSSRQSLNEPIGTMLEFPAVIGAFTTTVSEYQVRYSSTFRRPLNWARMLDTSAISNLSDIPLPGPAGPAPTCDLGEVVLSDTDRSLACAVVGFMVTSELTPVLQFLLDIAGVLLVLFYIWQTWLSKNG